MNNKVFFLKDSQINDWLIDGFSKRMFPIYFLYINSTSQYIEKSRIRRILFLHRNYFSLSLKALLKSSKNDIIISLLDVLGLYVFLLSKLFLKKRKIVILNVMFNEGTDFLTQMKRKLFSWMLKNEQIYPTVTSLELKKSYQNIFKLSQKEFFLLHDCYGKLEQYKRPYKDGNNSVFCGGTNGRDWSTLLKVAALLPQTKFVIVGPKRDTLGQKYPSNIDYFYNISYVKFQELIVDCSLLALPLNTEAPAGLIVLYTAGLMSKPVITTDNITMREYIISGENGILVKMGDYENFAKQIDLLLSNKRKQKELGERLFEKVELLGSPQTFVDKLIKITDKIQ
jgi:glycosyltransferase involved in cell wall biosynthesis